MSDVASILWLIPALPLLAAAVIAFLGPKALRERSHLPCVLALVLSCVLAFVVLFALRGAGEGAPAQVARSYTWAKVGDVDLGMTFRADGLTAIMLVTITFVGTLIAVFASGYMHGDPGYPRFFAAVSLFICAMTVLVLADNFLVLYLGWEGVGLCSYLLIGFWFEKPSAADAARKAFLVTRLGDMGLLLGIILLWALTGSLDYDTVFDKMQGADPYLVGGACLLLFCGAVGKSAQFPLHVWLPDAMEGPTPVSALIHAATMVTAGVYLVARCSALFFQVPGVQLVVAIIGGFTALLAALIAVTQNDLKRVLAYSTVSQLGYMFLGLGCGAVTAGVFHLFTHAFFKALLFLAAGSVMHAMGGVIDMRRFGGLKKILPWTRATFLAGALALAGFPLLSGFWSKDEILHGALEKGHGSAAYMTLFVGGLVTAFLTAFYTIRAYLMTFEGEERVPEEAGHHAHESPPVMTVPLAVLAVGAVGVGAIEPATHAFSGLLAGYTRGLEGLHAHPLDFGLMTLSGLVALAGIAAAWYVYALRPALAKGAADGAPALYQASLNKFFFDELYQGLIVRPLRGFADFCRVIDGAVVDGLVDLVGQVPRMFGQLYRPVQNGLVQFYALAMILSLAVFLLVLLSQM